MDLQALLDRARGGDRDAWNLLLGRLRPCLRELLRRRVSPEADASDLVNQVQMRMDAGFAGFRGASLAALMAWSRQIAANLLVDRARRLGPPSVPLPADLPEAPGPDPARVEEQARVASALDRLREPHRSIVVARFLDGEKAVRIAERLGQSPAWVRVTCKRGLEELRRQLEGEP
jgi:RNA polymerase sigma-70 factor (ECF subfamily)